jgi:hypothetical protein
MKSFELLYMTLNSRNISDNKQFMYTLYQMKKSLSLLSQEQWQNTCQQHKSEFNTITKLILRQLTYAEHVHST